MRRAANGSNEAFVRREIARAGVRAAALLAVFFLLPFGDNWLWAIVLALAIVSLVPFTIRRFHRVMRSDHALGDAISALVMTLLTLALSFASTYYVLASHNPESIGGLSTKLDSIYLEMTMISTVGFGDITAKTQGARLVATVNMLMNMVFLGASLRLLTWAAQRHRDAGAPVATDQVAQ